MVLNCELTWAEQGRAWMRLNIPTMCGRWMKYLLKVAKKTFLYEKKYGFVLDTEKQYRFNFDVLGV